MTETWRDIIGLEGFYQVSDLGRVRSLDRLITRKDGSSQVYKGTIMQPQLAGGGKDRRYLHVSLCRDGQRIGVFVHQLVAWAFLGEQKNGFEVHHLNRCTTDNQVSNLAYKEKSKHVSDHHRGSLNHQAILTEADVIEIKRLLSLNKPMTEISPLFGVTPSAIGRIKRGKNWKHVSATDPR